MRRRHQSQTVRCDRSSCSINIAMKLAVLVCLVAAVAPGLAQLGGYQSTTEKYRPTTQKYQTTPGYYQQPQIKLLNAFSNSDDKGNYEFGYEQDNGQKVQEVGKSFPGPHPGYGSISKVGSYEFISPEGQTFHVEYTADEDGYRAIGAHLPVGPYQLPEYAQHREQFPELYRSAPVQNSGSYA